MPQEPSFQLENLEYSARLGLWVLVSAHDITTSNLPVAGTTTLTATGTNGLKLPTGGRPDSSYDNYKYTHLSPAATAGYFRLNFVDVFPTTPLVTQRMDPVWGLVRTHSYLALTASELPLRATEYPASSGRYVLDATETQMSGDVCIVRIDTVAALTVSQTDNPVDEKTGDTFSRTRTWTIGETAPAAVALGTDGMATTVTQEAYRMWLSVNQPVNVRVGIENKRTYALYQAMVWPAVLTDFDVRNLTEYQEGSGYQKYTVATYGLAPAYADKVRVDVEEWWQKAAPTDTELSGKSAPFQPTGIHINGLRTPPAVSPCLHGEVVFTAEVYDETELAYSTYEVTIDATTPTTWPETFIDYEVEPDSGGYTVRKLTWYRPFVPVSSVTSSVTPA